jgi:hypothetical protein
MNGQSKNRLNRENLLYRCAMFDCARRDSRRFRSHDAACCAIPAISRCSVAAALSRTRIFGSYGIGRAH